MVTNDYELIKSIIARDDILPTLNHGEMPSMEQIMDDSIVYFYEPDVGLFPANVIGDHRLLMHVAIPKENRGKKALKAARKLVKQLIDKGYTLLARAVDKPHIKRFITMIGAEHTGYDGKYHNYILRGV